MKPNDLLDRLYPYILCAALFIICLIAVSQKVNWRTNYHTELRNHTATKVELQETQRQLDRAKDLLRKAYNVDEVDNLTTITATVDVSAYTAREAECDSTPEVTADMTPSRVGLLAVSRDLMFRDGLTFGDRVLLEHDGVNYGIFEIRDVMNARWRNRVDVLHGNLKAARKFGLKKGATITWISS